MNAAAIRGDWAGRVIDGRFPLLQWLGGSTAGAVFLTELSEGSQKAVIKLIPADAEDAESRIAASEAAMALSHPNLTQVYAHGRCEIDSVQQLYVVTEFADEVLAEILKERPLSLREAREMLAPAVDALSYLHSKGFVHSRLKPSNIMAAGDRLKLSTDGLSLPGAIGRPFPERTVYDAPEVAHGPFGPAADVWSLGATLVEVLTQRPPVWGGAANTEPVVPETVPQPFAAVARECLRTDPARRCTLEEIRTRLEPGAALQRPAGKAGKTAHAKGRLAALFAALAILLAGIGILNVFFHRAQPPSPATEEQNVPAANPAPAPAPNPTAAATPAPTQRRAVENPASSGAARKGTTVREVQPDVPASALRTIVGKITVTIRLAVDENGNVTDAAFESAGPSRYFANEALDAARQWKFKPAQVNGRAVPSAWLLHFQFTQSGIDVTPTETAP
ncbi:MAG: TonB family protein [Terracidiphilus sp.]